MEKCKCIRTYKIGCIISYDKILKKSVVEMKEKYSIDKEYYCIVDQYKDYIVAENPKHLKHVFDYPEYVVSLSTNEFEHYFKLI